MDVQTNRDISRMIKDRS